MVIMHLIINFQHHTMEYYLVFDWSIIQGVLVVNQNHQGLIGDVIQILVRE